MVNFAYPLLLLLLIAVPFFALLYWYARYRRRKMLTCFGRQDLLETLMPDVSKYLPTFKIIVALAAIAAMSIMLARPRTKGKVIEEELQGIELIVAVDVSNSMLASSTDELRGASRLKRAKFILNSLISRLKNDRIGLIVFAGDAFTQLPLTPDYISARMYLNEISTGIVGNQGTDIGAAIQLAMNSFSGEPDVERSIIVITDAEDQIGDAMTMAKVAAEEGIQINVVGLGSGKGAQIPLDNSYKNFLKDDSGQVVTTYLNEELAKSIAEEGGGIYVNGASGSAINELVTHLSEMKTANLGKVNYGTNDERFPVFAWIALVFILLDCLFSNRKIGFLRKYNFFGKGSTVVAMLLCAGFSASAQALMPPMEPNEDTTTRKERKYVREGNEQFAAGNFGDAELLYLNALDANNESEVAKYNLALTQLMLDPQMSVSTSDSSKVTPRELALGSFAGLAMNANDPLVKESAAFNLGNLMFEAYQQQNPQALNLALDCYKRALRVNPTNEEARRNMRYIQKLLEQQQNNNQQSQDQQNEQNQEQQQQEQQQPQQQQQQLQQGGQGSLSPETRKQILNAVEAKDAAARKKNQVPPTPPSRRGNNW